MTQKQTERRPSGERGNPQRGPAMTGPVPIRRTTEIEEITNLYFIHPLASRLVPFFAQMRFTPNAVSVTGMLFGILSADRKSTRLNSSHQIISYAVFCLKKKKT